MTDNSDTPLLGDIRVIEVASMVFAPSACVVLADFGAEVIKVEPLHTGDLNRNWHKIHGLPVSDMAYPFQVDNRNKKSIALDLKSEAGYEVLRKLVAGADVLVTNYRLKALQRLKLEYETIRAINPRIVYALATGFGEHGEERHKPGYDTVCYWSRSAIETQVFPYEGWLSAFPYGAGDHPSGMTLFAAIMTGLYRRQQTSEGCKVSTSLLANGAWANSVMLQAQLSGARFKDKRPRDNAYNFISLHYPTRDNRLLKLSMVNSKRDWRPFCAALSRSDFLDDDRFSTDAARVENMPELIREISATFVTQDIAHWQSKLEQHDIPHTIVATYEEAANDKQKAANDIVVPLDHPEYGQMRTINSPFEVSGADKIKPGAAPGLGEHTREVLVEIGYSEDEIQQLLEDDCIQQLE
ncbi:MAG: CoA transferase [Proteobacteria bacterium]|nr:CoA transferase [Pseudomonadota bacterium]